MSFLHTSRTFLSRGPFADSLSDPPNFSSEEAIRPLRQRIKPISSTTGPEPVSSCLQNVEHHDTGETTPQTPSRKDAKSRDSTWSNSDPANLLGQDEEENVLQSGLEISPYPEENNNLQEKRRTLLRSKAKLERDIKKGSEYLLLLHARLTKIAMESHLLRQSMSSEKHPSSKPKSDDTSPSPPNPPSSRPPSLSPARKACNEAYDKMSPLNQHLLREKMHQDGIRLRDTRREAEERREWEEYRQRSSPPNYSASRYSPMSERAAQKTRNREFHRGMQEMQDEATQLETFLRNREQQEYSEAWETYELRWKDLNSSAPSSIRFSEFPWPTKSVFFKLPTETIKENLPDLFTTVNVSSFLFSECPSQGKTKKQRLREALLRYHPDKFGTRWLPRFSEENGDKECVREAVGVLARILGEVLHKEQ